MRICKICDGGPGNQGVCTCGFQDWEGLSDGEKQDVFQIGYRPPVGTILHNNVDLVQRPAPPGEREGDEYRYG